MYIAIILTDKSDAGVDSSCEEEANGFLNGHFDANILHLFNHGDDPSSSSEEECCDENV